MEHIVTIETCATYLQLLHTPKTSSNQLWSTLDKEIISN